MNPVLIFIPVAAAIVLFFIFKPSKKKEDLTPNVVPDPSEPVMNYPIAFEPIPPVAEPVPVEPAPVVEPTPIIEPAPVAEVGGGDPVEVQPEETVPAKPKKAAVKKKVPIKK